MTINNKRKRIITCQGTTQLVTVLAVLNHREKQRDLRCAYEDYLVIYDLGSPLKQLSFFVSYINKMAKILHFWKSIHYISSDKINFFGTLLKEKKNAQCFNYLQNLLKIKEVDEIYVMRDWGFGNELLLAAYKNAMAICYGDGMGFYFSEKYFYRCLNCSGKQDKTKTDWKRKNEIECGFFLMPDLLEKNIPMQIEAYNAKNVINILKQASVLVNDKYIASLRKRFCDKFIMLLLTGNHYSRGRMTLDNEITAYCEMIEKDSRAKNSILIIKSHPRDAKSTTLKLANKIKNRVSDVIVLENELFYLPFEVFYLSLFYDDDNRITNDIKVFSCSTAGVSLKYLFNVSTVIGFGKEKVTKYFFETHVKGRLAHEYDLRTYIKKIDRHIR